MTTYRKERTGAPTGFFACEAAGLRWIAVPGGPPVVQVLEVGDTWLDLERLHPVPADRRAARRLGEGLATLHHAGAAAFGVPPDGWSGDIFFGPLDDPRRLPSGRHERWGEFVAERRLSPLATMLEAAGVGDLAPLHRLAERARTGDYDDGFPPARVHGDLWSGNVLWTERGAVLIDPAAHGDHPLTDLAMLELFGLPYLDDVLEAYEGSASLPAGWRDRLGLHQVFPVGMHAVLFGGAYVASFRELVARYV